MPARVKHPDFGRQSVPMGRVSDWGLEKHPDADRIALREVRGDLLPEYVAERWNSRVVLARAVRMQQRGGRRCTIRPVVPLSPGEGY